MTPNNDEKKPLKFTVLTLFPELIKNYLADALLSKAIQQNKLIVEILALRDFADGRYKAIDDIPYGGGDGMVFKPAILEAALQALEEKSPGPKRVIYVSPQGKKWNHDRARKMALMEDDVDGPMVAQTQGDIVLLCGRYAGIDQRFIEKYVDEEISIGDYVLSGGELAALVMIECVSRFIPGVLGDSQSAIADSFEDQFLEAPQFTKPQLWGDVHVPEVLASGHHQKIAEWKWSVSRLVTLTKRPDLFYAHFKTPLGSQQKKELTKLVRFHRTLPARELQTLHLADLDLTPILNMLEAP